MPERFTFDRAFLRDVLRFLAEAAGIPFVSIPENAMEAQQLVTFTMTATPFTALESIAKQYGIRLVYEDGVWFLRTASEFNGAGIGRSEAAIYAREQENELVGVMYQLRYDSAERVDFRSDLSGPGVQSSSNQGNQSSETGVNNSPALPLQNSQKVFAFTPPKLVNDVRAILGLKPLKYNADGSIEDPEVAGGYPVQSRAERLLGSGDSAGGSLGLGDFISIDKKTINLDDQPPGLAPDDAHDQGARDIVRMKREESLRSLGVMPVYVPTPQPQVIYNSESNFLWVVATRRQHKWVAEYLSKVDTPQELIAIEIKFLETKKNPQYDLGINWQGMLGTGITLRGSAGASIGGEYGFGFNREKEWGSTNTRSSGFDNSSYRNGSILDTIANAVANNQTNLTITDILSSSASQESTSLSDATSYSYDRSENSSGKRKFNLDFSGQNTTIPYEAVLSMDQVSVTLQAFMEDRDSSIVQYPRVLTLNNKEVAITSAEYTPVNTGTSDVGGGQGGNTQTVGGLGYLPTGTQINILPKVVNKNQIAMTVAITVSSVIGELPINLGTGINLYPVTSQRVYNATLQVDSGYTLAVGGLEKVDDRNVQGGVPVLKDIPGVGYFFRNKNKKRDRINLIIFITPYLIGDPARTPGISETPQSVVPLRPGVPQDPPTFTPDGRLSGGDAALPEAFAWLDFQLRYFRQINMEGMISLESIRKLKDVISVARLLLSDRQLVAGAPPYDPATVQGRDAIRAEEVLAELNRVLAATQENLM